MLDLSRMPDPLGPGTVVQLVPFQRWSSAVDEAPLVKPTAQALLAELASTPRSSSTAGLGPDTTLQLVPFHRWMSGRRNGLLDVVGPAHRPRVGGRGRIHSEEPLSNWVRPGLATRVQAAAEAGVWSGGRQPRSATHTARGYLWRRGPGLLLTA